MTAGIPLCVWVNMCLFVHSEALGQLSSANGLQREWSLEGDGTTVSGDFRGHPDSCSSGHLHCADFKKLSRWDRFHWVQSNHWNHLKVTRKITPFIQWKTICCQCICWKFSDNEPLRSFDNTMIWTQVQYTLYEKEVALLEINVKV